MVSGGVVVAILETIVVSLMLLLLSRICSGNGRNHGTLSGPRGPRCRPLRVRTPRCGGRATRIRPRRPRTAWHRTRVPVLAHASPRVGDADEDSLPARGQLHFGPHMVGVHVRKWDALVQVAAWGAARTAAVHHLHPVLEPRRRLG